MDNKETFTTEEQKTIDKYSLICALFNLIGGIIICYVNNVKIKVGTYHLYLVTLLFIISTITIIYMNVIYFCKLRKIKKYRKRYCILNTICVLLFALHCIICIDYTADIFSGTKTIVTSEYSTLWGYFYTEIDGEEIHLDMPDETIKILRDNDYIDGEEIFDINTSTYRYKKKAHVTYYPHSKVLKNAFVEN